MGCFVWVHAVKLQMNLCLETKDVYLFEPCLPDAFINLLSCRENQHKFLKTLAKFYFVTDFMQFNECMFTVHF